MEKGSGDQMRLAKTFISRRTLLTAAGLGLCGVGSGCGGGGDKDKYASFDVSGLPSQETSRPLTRLTYVAVGDSIMFDVGNSGLLAAFDAELRARTILPVRGVSVAIAGYTSNEHVPGHPLGHYEVMRNAVLAEDANVVSALLGASDNLGAISAKDFHGNLSRMCRQLYLDCPMLERIYLHEPTFLGYDNVRFTRLLEEYPAVLRALHDGVRIFYGARGLTNHGLQLWNQGRDVFYAAYYDGLHPTPPEARIIARYMAVAMTSDSAISSGG